MPDKSTRGAVAALDKRTADGANKASGQAKAKVKDSGQTPKDGPKAAP